MSEQKRYTAQEMREVLNTSWHDLDREMVHDMLRQAADAEEDLAKVKARLEAVVNMLSNVYHDCRYSNAVSMFKEEYDAILRAARGETSRNGNNSVNSSENMNIKGSDNGK